MPWGDSGKHFPQVDESLNLKICDLCGSLNVSADTECVVCRWHGHFECRPEVVRIALEVEAARREASESRNSVQDLTGPEDRLESLGSRIRFFFSKLLRLRFPRRY